ncbi:MAG: hypothetical protein NC336_08175 [Clostridium sp.]|nr:hypothetical protein [Clostridium sp.]
MNRLTMTVIGAADAAIFAASADGPGSWNSSESGHPHLFDDPQSGRTFLFYQGNNPRGQNRGISKRELLRN